MPEASRSPLVAAVALGIGLVVGGCSSSSTTSPGEDAATHKDAAKHDSMAMPAYGVAVDASHPAKDAGPDRMAAPLYGAVADAMPTPAYGVAVDASHPAKDAGHDAMPMPAYGVAVDASHPAKDAGHDAMPMPAYGVAVDASHPAKDAGDAASLPAYGPPAEDVWA